jgi:hypothetical protein
MTLPWQKKPTKKTNAPASPLKGMFGIARPSVKKTYAGERMQKMLRERTMIFLRLFLFGSIGGIIFLIVIGTLAGAALSLKTGEKLSIVSAAEGLLRQSPLGQYLPQTPVEEKYDVIGLPGIPEYPQSEFIFSGAVSRTQQSFEINLQGYSNTDQQELFRFLSNGQSVYFLPVGTRWSEVVKFYKEELPKSGWNHVSSVGVEDLERIPGEFFVKENKGLHVYAISHDIWYEYITKEQAENGLKDRVVAYKTKQLLVQSASGNELPKETWWKLRYTNEWEMTVSNHFIIGEPIVSFRNKKTPGYLVVSPLVRYKEKPEDVDYAYLEKTAQEYLKNWLATRPPSVTMSNFQTNKVTIADAKAIEVVSSKDQAYFAFVINKENSIVYSIEYFQDTNSDFFEYVKGNIRFQKK